MVFQISEVVQWETELGLAEKLTGELKSEGKDILILEGSNITKGWMIIKYWNL